MKILHTSDWHIGRALYGRKRYEEFEAFLNWLAGLIEDEKIDVLLVAGDVFDNSTSSNHAQELYYRFLCRVAVAPNRHVVVTAGNHDSPSFLNAPRELLKFLNIHVVGCASESPQDELVIIAGPNNEPRLINAVLKRHPFEVRYDRIENVDWESCSRVLDSASQLEALQKGW